MINIRFINETGDHLTYLLLESTLKELNFAVFGFSAKFNSRETQICDNTRNLIPAKLFISADRDFVVANRKIFWAEILTLKYEISMIRVLTGVYFSNQLQILQFLPFGLSSLSWYPWKQKTNVCLCFETVLFHEILLLLSRYVVTFF